MFTITALTSPTERQACEASLTSATSAFEFLNALTSRVITTIGIDQAGIIMGRDIAQEYIADAIARLDTLDRRRAGEDPDTSDTIVREVTTEVARMLETGTGEELEYLRYSGAPVIDDSAPVASLLHALDRRQARTVRLRRGTQAGRATTAAERMRSAARPVCGRTTSSPPGAALTARARRPEPTAGAEHAKPCAW